LKQLQIQKEKNDLRFGTKTEPKAEQIVQPPVEQIIQPQVEQIIQPPVEQIIIQPPVEQIIQPPVEHRIETQENNILDVSPEKQIMILEDPLVESDEEVEVEEEKYSQKIEEKLATLSSMGFINRKLNVELLMNYNSDINQVVQELLYFCH